MNCANCDNELIAPEWSEYRYERQIRHVWRCWKCDSCFETIVETQVTEDAMTSDEIFPSGKHSGDSGTIAQQVSWPARACAPAGVLRKSAAVAVRAMSVVQIVTRIRAVGSPVCHRHPARRAQRSAMAS